MGSDRLHLRASQFESLEYAAFLRNPPTNTNIVQPNHVKIIEFLSWGLILQLPTRTCAAGHVLVLNLYPRATMKTLGELNKDPDLMSFTCKVKEVEKDKDIGDRVTVDFYQIDKKAWSKFLDAFTAKQVELNLLIKVMRDE